MSTPITTDTTLFDAEGFCPGAGVLAVHVTDGYDFASDRLEEAVKSSTPCGTSFGRTASMFTSRVRALAYSHIRIELTKLYEAWNNHMNRKDKMPVVSIQFMEKWFERMGMDRNFTMSQLGVAQPGDSIDICLTSKGGRKLVIHTHENAYGEVFARRKEQAYQKITSKTQLLEALTDVTLLSALAQFNRKIIYWQVSEALGFSKSHTEWHQLTTITSGIDYLSWEVLAAEVRAEDGCPFLLPYGKDSWAVCIAPKGKDNRPFPWEVIHSDDESPLPVRNRYETKASVTCQPIETAWFVGKNL